VWSIRSEPAIRFNSPIAKWRALSCTMKETGLGRALSVSIKLPETVDGESSPRYKSCGGLLCLYFLSMIAEGLGRG